MRTETGCAASTEIKLLRSARSALGWPLVVGLMVLLVAGCATDSAKQFDKRFARTKAALIAADDPDSLAAAGLLIDWLKDGSATRLALLARASEKAPDRADLTWLHFQACRQVTSCDPKPIAARLRALDPENGVGWLGQIDQASSASDETQARATVLAIGNSQRFDVYWAPIIVSTARAIAKTRTMDSSVEVLVIVMGMMAAQAIPAYHPIARVCKGPALADTSVLAACRRVSAVLRHGDTYISESIGLAIAKRVWPDGSPEYQDAVNERRVLSYRMEMALKISTDKISTRQNCDDDYAARYLELLATHRTEQEVVLAEIVNAGIDPNPPEDWKPTLLHQ